LHSFPVDNSTHTHGDQKGWKIRGEAEKGSWIDNAFARSKFPFFPTYLLDTLPPSQSASLATSRLQPSRAWSSGSWPSLLKAQNPWATDVFRSSASRISQIRPTISIALTRSHRRPPRIAPSRSRTEVIVISCRGFYSDWEKAVKILHIIVVGFDCVACDFVIAIIVGRIDGSYAI